MNSAVFPLTLRKTVNKYLSIIFNASVSEKKILYVISTVMRDFNFLRGKKRNVISQYFLTTNRSSIRRLLWAAVSSLVYISKARLQCSGDSHISLDSVADRHHACRPESSDAVFNRLLIGQ